MSCFGLAAALLTFTAPLSHAEVCQPIADLVVRSKADLRQVTIKRSARLSDPSSIPATVLCAEDEVSLAKGKHVSVIIRYRSNPPGDVELATGMAGRDRATLPILNPNTVPANAWNALLSWFFDRDDGIIQRPLLTRVVRSITAPLSRGEDPDSPYFLLPDIDEIHFFWQGGQDPWTLEVIDPRGELKTRMQTTIPEATFHLTGKAGEQYTLTISSADGRRLSKPIVFEPITPVQASMPRDSWSRLFPLMADPDKNWRLYLWNVVRTMPEGATQRSVLNHLRADDI